jgi:glycerol-3-phosphate acyltransferase PlsX
VVQEAARLLSASQLNYIGFVEGGDIFTGEVDVIVTDGFTGNVALKSIEGVAKMLIAAVKDEYTRNPLRYLSAFISGVVSWRVVQSLRREFDPRTYNGASMVGLNGVVIKSHGSADATSFANAIRVAQTEAQKGVPSHIADLLLAQTAPTAV